MRGARARLQARVVRLREAVCFCRCDGFLRPPGGSTKASDGSAPGRLAPPGSVSAQGFPGPTGQWLRRYSVSLERGPNRRTPVAGWLLECSWAGSWQLGSSLKTARYNCSVY